MRYSLSPWWDNPAFKKRIRRSRLAISPHHGSVGPDGTFRQVAMATVTEWHDYYTKLRGALHLLEQAHSIAPEGENDGLAQATRLIITELTAAAIELNDPGDL